MQSPCGRKEVGQSEELKGWSCGYSRESASCTQGKEAGDVGECQPAPHLVGRAVAAESMAGSRRLCIVSKRVAFQRRLTVFKTLIKRYY